METETSPPRKTSHPLRRSFRWIVRLTILLLVVVSLSSFAAWAAAPRLLSPKAPLTTEPRMELADLFYNRTRDASTIEEGRITISEAELNALAAGLLSGLTENSAAAPSIQGIELQLKPGIVELRGIASTPPEIAGWVKTSQIGFDFTIAPMIRGNHLLLPVRQAHIGSIPVPATFLLSLLQGRVVLPEGVQIVNATPSYDLEQLQPFRTRLGTIRVMPIRLTVEDGQMQVQWLYQWER